eukprot:521298_1
MFGTHSNLYNIKSKTLCSIMKLFLLCVLFLKASKSLQSECNPQKQSLQSGKISILHTMNPIFGPHQREWHIYVPTQYTSSTSVPLLLLFHGLNDECGRFIQNTGFIPYAERDNFIIISVCGTRGREGIGFNAGTCCGFPADSTTNDIAFASWLVHNTSALLCITEEEVFISGFSNGAFMAEVVACNASEIFRASASISGVVELRPGNQRGLAQCDKEYNSAPHYTSLLNVHGTSDPLVPFAGDPVLGFPPIHDDIQRWYDRNRCTGNYSVTLKNDKYSNQLYSDCAHNTEIELVMHYGGTHEWPEDQYFNTTDYIMQFLHRNGMNSGTPRTDKME